MKAEGPISRARRELAEAMEAFWRENPHAVLPIVVEEGEREDALQGLRLRDLAPENRRPLVLFEAPFWLSHVYWDGLREAIVAHYERMRARVGEEGPILPPFPAEPVDGVPSAPHMRAIRGLAESARLLVPHFEGIAVVLAPERVLDLDAWQGGIRWLGTAVHWLAPVRVAVLVPPDSPLSALPGAVRFRVDHAELAHAYELPVPPPSRLPEHEMAMWSEFDEDDEDDALDAAIGLLSIPAISPDDPPLQSVLVDAARAERERPPWKAGERYLVALQLSRAGHLSHLEAMIRMALARQYVSVGVPEMAARTYRSAARYAACVDAWPLACQAWLAFGELCISLARYHDALVGYREAAEAAKYAEVTSLRIEALRMAGICLLFVGRQDEAVQEWCKAIACTDERPELSSLNDVGAALVEQLEQRGMRRQAQHVRHALGLVRQMRTVH